MRHKLRKKAHVNLIGKKICSDHIGINFKVEKGFLRMQKEQMHLKSKQKRTSFPFFEVNPHGGMLSSR